METATAANNIPAARRITPAAALLAVAAETIALFARLGRGPYTLAEVVVGNYDLPRFIRIAANAELYDVTEGLCETLELLAHKAITADEARAQVERARAAILLDILWTDEDEDEDED